MNDASREDLAGALPCAPGDIDRFLSEPGSGVMATLEGVQGDILVLGAGGKMGLHLCLMLKRGLEALGRDNRIYAASRFQTLNSREAYEAAGVETLAGDFRDDAFLSGLPDCPTVFYLVGTKFGTSNNPELLHEINVEVARRSVRRFRNSRIVAFSTGCVYSFVEPASGGSREDAATDPVGDYALSCVERERRFEEGSVEGNTPVVLIRLNYSVEFRYGVLVDIGQKVLSGEPLDVTMGYVNLIWQRDAVDQIIQCLGLAAVPAAPINITGPEVLSIRELAAKFGKIFSREPVFTGTEEETTWLSNASKSHQLFGKPPTDVDTMIQWIAAWLAHGGGTHGKPTGFEKRDGKF